MHLKDSTQNQYQPLFTAKNHCTQNSVGSVNNNLSYRRKTIPSKDRHCLQRHNIIRLQFFCGCVKLKVTDITLVKNVLQ